VPPDPYERLQAARTTVKTLKDERATLAVRLAELARGGDEDELMGASRRLDTLPGELLRAELDLAKADHQAARATLVAAETNLAGAGVDLADPDPDPAPDPLSNGGPPSSPPDPPSTGGRTQRVSDEHWVAECRVAVERAQRRERELQAAVDRAHAEPADEARHRGFAKRVLEARDAIERARTASRQAELDLIQANELAKVALDGLGAASTGVDWRALEHARQARADAAGAVGPAWEATRFAGLRVARAQYELDRLIEERLGGPG
jgi:hypothetical protein